MLLKTILQVWIHSLYFLLNNFLITSVLFAWSLLEFMKTASPSSPAYNNYKIIFLLVAIFINGVCGFWQIMRHTVVFWINMCWWFWFVSFFEADALDRNFTVGLFSATLEAEANQQLPRQWSGRECERGGLNARSSSITISIGERGKLMRGEQQLLLMTRVFALARVSASVRSHTPILSLSFSKMIPMQNLIQVKYDKK